MLRLLIIDDEARARQHLRQLLAQYDNLEIAGEADSVAKARPLIEMEKPDAIFLDIEMPGNDGFSLLRSLGNPPPVVFVTAHARHAIEAFDFEAVDYLLKPVRTERLARTLERLRSPSRSAPPWQTKDRICLKTPERTVVTSPEKIVALEAEGDFTRIFIEGEHPMLICHNLSHYEKILPAPLFVRLDRSLMINRERIKKVEPIGRNYENMTLLGREKPFLLGRTAHRRLTEVLREE
jgi:two-component system, LytTR family, response regulator